MLGFLFGKKGKFKLKENMEVELEIISPDGARSYFTQVVESTSKKTTFLTPKEGNKFIKLAPNNRVRCIVLIDDTIFETKIKVITALDREFEAKVSKDSITYYDTILSKFNKKKGDLKIEAEVPLDFRAMTTSHLQRAITKLITPDAVEVVTNLPVPEGTHLKLIFKVPESPPVETEGTSEKSIPLEEDSRKSKTRIVFSDKAKQTNMIERVSRYIVHYLRRLERRKELEEKGEIPKQEKQMSPPRPNAKKPM